MAELITAKLLLIAVFLLIVTLIETLAYSTRIAGTRVRLIATAISLFSTLVIVSRFSTMIQQPMTAKLINAAPEGNVMKFIEEQYRILIGVTSIGVLLGMLLFPTFILIFSKAIVQMSEKRGSIVALVKGNMNIRGMKYVVSCVRLPRLSLFKRDDITNHS